MYVVQSELLSCGDYVHLYPCLELTIRRLKHCLVVTIYRLYPCPLVTMYSLKPCLVMTMHSLNNVLVVTMYLYSLNNVLVVTMYTVHSVQPGGDYVQPMNSLNLCPLMKKYILKSFWVLSIHVVNPEGFYSGSGSGFGSYLPSHSGSGSGPGKTATN